MFSVYMYIIFMYIHGHPLRVYRYPLRVSACVRQNWFCWVLWTIGLESASMQLKLKCYLFSAKRVDAIHEPLCQRTGGEEAKLLKAIESGVPQSQWIWRVCIIHCWVSPYTWLQSQPYLFLSLSLFHLVKAAHEKLKMSQEDQPCIVFQTIGCFRAKKYSLGRVPNIVMKATKPHILMKYICGWPTVSESEAN